MDIYQTIFNAYEKSDYSFVVSEFESQGLINDDDTGYSLLPYYADSLYWVGRIEDAARTLYHECVIDYVTREQSTLIFDKAMCSLTDETQEKIKQDMISLYGNH